MNKHCASPLLIRLPPSLHTTTHRGHPTHQHHAPTPRVKMECVDGVCKFVSKSQRGGGQKAGGENDENAAPALPLVAVGDKPPMPLPLEGLEEGGEAMMLQGLCDGGGKGGRVVVLGKCGEGGMGRWGGRRQRTRGCIAFPCRLPASVWLASTRSPLMHLLELSGCAIYLLPPSFPP